MPRSWTTKRPLSPEACSARYSMRVCKKSSRNHRKKRVKGTGRKYLKAAAPTQNPPRSYRKRYSARGTYSVTDPRERSCCCEEEEGEGDEDEDVGETDDGRPFVRS